MPHAVRRHWFLLTLIAVLGTGLMWPATMQPVVGWVPGDVVVGVVTFIMALPLETGALWAAARRPGAAWLAIGLNSAAAPPLGWLAGQMFPPELATGILVATTVPCTLASAAVWTRRAGGNDAVAFLVTIVTNLSCFLVVPTWLWLLVRAENQAAIQQADIDYRQIVVGLILLVVLPIVAAQALRQSPAIARWAAHHKPRLSHLAQCGVLLIVFVGAVECGLRLTTITGGTATSAANLGCMVLAVSAVHGILLASGFALSRALRFSRGDAIAVTFSGSQKTLMVGAYLASAIGPLAILPMVAYHAAQLMIDTLVADRFASRTGGPPVREEDEALISEAPV